MNNGSKALGLKSEEALKGVWDSLTDEQRKKAKQCKTPDELAALAKKAGIELPDELPGKVSSAVLIVSGDNEIKCPQCGEPYSNGRMTVETVHPDFRRFHCPCGKSFPVIG